MNFEQYVLVGSDSADNDFHQYDQHWNGYLKYPVDSSLPALKFAVPYGLFLYHCRCHHSDILRYILGIYLEKEEK